MPWTVENDPEKCSASMPWAVIRLSNGVVEGCHATEEDANSQMAALYAGEEDPADERDDDDVDDDDGMYAVIPTRPSDIAHPNGLAASDLHVTLRYFNQVSAMDLLQQRNMSELARDVSNRYGPFDARVCGMGYLGPNSVVVAFLEAAPIEDMHREINEALGDSVSAENYPHFIPHMTIGRDITFDREYVEQLMATPITLGGIRLALGNRNTDYTLGVPVVRTASNNTNPSVTLTFSGMNLRDDPEEVEVVEVEETVEVEIEKAPEEIEEIEEVDPPEPDVEVDLTFDRDKAEARVSSVPPAEMLVSKKASRDLRGLPQDVLARMMDQGEDVGIVDRVGRGLFEMRFQPEMRLNADGSVFLHGYGTVYDFPYEVMGGPPYGWVETITRGACLRSVQHGADVRLLINHDGIALARTRSGTLQLESDDIGLYCCAPSLDPRSPTVQSLISAMNRGDMDEMSFAFKVIEQDWNDDYSERQISEVRLFDVSVVTYPANPATVTNLRSADEVRESEGMPTDLAQAQIALLDMKR